MDRERKVNEAGRDIRVANRMAKCSQDNVIELMNVARLRFEVNRVPRTCPFNSRAICKTVQLSPLENIRSDRGKCFHLFEDTPLSRAFVLRSAIDDCDDRRRRCVNLPTEEKSKHTGKSEQRTTKMEGENDDGIPISPLDCGINSCSSFIKPRISSESFWMLHNSSSWKSGVICLQRTICEITLPMLDGPVRVSETGAGKNPCWSLS